MGVDVMTIVRFVLLAIGVAAFVYSQRKKHDATASLMLILATLVFSTFTAGVESEMRRHGLGWSELLFGNLNKDVATEIVFGGLLASGAFMALGLVVMGQLSRLLAETKPVSGRGKRW